jgi:hypothetical protein
MKKYFTAQEAIATLPLVKSIVKDILRVGSALRDRASYVISSGLGKPEDDEDCIALAESLQDLYIELEELGCEYKDWSYSIGLVDFPSLLEGNEILLCWRSDEETISHYHGIHEGFSGRKPLPSVYNSSFYKD